MDRVEMPDNIRDHSFVVAEIASCLAGALIRAGVRLNARLVEASALLHDIAKGWCILNGGNHALEGGKLLRGWGYSRLAPIVEDHIDLREDFLPPPLTESLVVNYSDKLVKHDEVVSLEERFTDLAFRYAKNPGHEIYFKERLVLYLKLERAIFAAMDGESACSAR